eukprot:COSAG05_NODE_961_length_6421_cov_4.206738_3_plen_721_part_00
MSRAARRCFRASNNNEFIAELLGCPVPAIPSSSCTDTGFAAPAGPPLSLPLSEPEVVALCESFVARTQSYDATPAVERVLSELSERLACVVRARRPRSAGFGEWFVRLSARSPKDALQGACTCAADVIAVLSRSRRCFDDLVAHRYHRVQSPVSLHLLPWRARSWCYGSDPTTEMRCFVHGGCLVAASHQFPGEPFEFIAREQELVRTLAQFVEELYAKVPGLDREAVADIEVTVESDGRLRPQLVELNPYYDRGSTSAAMFDWVDDDALLCPEEGQQRQIVLRYSGTGFGTGTVEQAFDSDSGLIMEQEEEPVPPPINSNAVQAATAATPSAAASEQAARTSQARALLREAELLEHEGEPMAAMKKYQAAYKLDRNLEEEQFGMYDMEKDVADVEVQTGEVPHFKLEDLRWMGHLETEGFVVITDCCTPDEITGATNSLWSFLEGLDGAKLRRTDPESWGGESWPVDPKTGILTMHNFQHSDFCWRGRLNPNVQRAFASVWGVETQDLITSFDSGNIFRPWHEAGRPEWKTQGGWWHVDQNAAEPICHMGKMSVQGVLTYTDATAATGGLTVVPRSHLDHSAMCERHPPVFGDYFPLKSSDPLLSLPAQLVTAPAGSLLLWDSRTVHCNTPAQVASDAGAASPSQTPSQTLELLRAVSYVCMVPRSFADADTLRNRVGAFEAREGTSHWPQYLGQTQAEKTRSIADASAEVQRLVGALN